MAACSYCNSMILFGGARIGQERFCNERCLASWQAASCAEELPPELVAELTQQIHAGPCPKCQGRGPVDVYTSHSVWSIFVMTSWRSTPQVCCRSCGFKSQALSMATSMLFGWWGFPWGLIMTPIQVGRNVMAMTGSHDPLRPSEQLERIARIQLGHMVSQNSQAQ